MREAGILLGVVLLACGPNDRGHGDKVDAQRGGIVDSTGGGGPDASTIDAVWQIYVYAHTSSALYRVDPDTYAITMVGNFVWPTGVVSDTMTDLAIDKNGRMLGVSFTSVYEVDPMTAKCTLLSNQLAGSFNGLSFVPASQLGQTGDDVLVGTRNTDGKAFQVNPMTGATTQVGDMGGTFTSSGDLVAVTSFGIVQTVPGTGGGHDRLATLAPNTLAASAVGATDTGYNNIWGIAFWKNKIFGFTDQGEFILIDPVTGVGTLVSSNGVAWWGAAVTTAAPIVQ
jgi:hypothetical protein